MQTEKVLRALFWKLFFRGRALQQMRRGRQTQRTMAWGVGLIIYVCIGASVGIVGLVTDAQTLSILLHSATAFLIVFNLASSAGTFLFNQEEAEILLHRPVTAETLLRAKAWVLTGSAWATGLAFNLGGIIMGCFAKGGGWLFAPAHLFSLTLMTVFCAAVVVLIYNLCLRWFGRERLDSLTATAQTVMTVVFIAGPQIFPRLIQMKSLQNLSSQKWLWAPPTSWFAALDAVVLSPVKEPWLWLPAGLALVTTAVISWLGFHKLASDYGEGLTMLNESTGRAPAEGRRRWLSALVRSLPLRWWLRDSAERSSFLLTTAYMMRDRETKTRLYPSLVPIAIMVVVMALGGNTGSGGTFLTSFRIMLAAAYLAFLPVTAMECLKRSEHWRAADLFRYTPLTHWASLFDGARKAVVVFLLVPAVVLLLGLTLALTQDLNAVLLFVPSLMLFPVWTMVPGVLGMWLPLSAPYDQLTQGVSGCLKMMIFLIVSSAVAGLGLWAWSTGWFVWMLVGEAVLVAITQYILRRLISRIGWSEE